MRTLTLLVAALCLTSACEDSEVEPPPSCDGTRCCAAQDDGQDDALNCLPDPMTGIEYFVIGDFYGECVDGASCIDNFKVSIDGVWEDTLDNYPNSTDTLVGSFDVEVPDSSGHTYLAYSLTSLSQEFESGSVIGQPDAGDWGGYYLEIKFDDGPSWHVLVDKNRDNVPAALHDRLDNLDQAITELDQADY